jgi:phosphoserine phosphatase RsbU/P
MPPQPSTASPPENPAPRIGQAWTGRRRRRSEFVAALERFWQRVTEGLAVSQLWSQFKQDAQTGFRLYRQDINAQPHPDQRRRERFLQIVQELTWAILGKLTPARRVLLLIGIVLLILPGGGIEIRDAHGRVEFTGPMFQFWGGLVLFVLLMLEVADRVVMKRDLEIARDIQSWLLPASPPIVPGLTVAFTTRPANTVAGDFYDIFPRPEPNANSSKDSRFLLAVADVAGKSIPAALLMATFQASFKTLSSTPCSLLELVAGMNRYACSNSQGGLRFTTAILAEFHPATRLLSYVNAGHNNPLLRRSSGKIERLDVGGLPLGIQLDATYASAEMTLDAGDWLAIFTDGLVEAENQFAEEYGEERLLLSLNAGASATPEVVLQRVISDVNQFAGTTPQHDDITCMLIKAS